MNLSYVILVGVLFVLFFVALFFFLRWRKGSINIIPENHTYITGEKIKGKIVLNIKKNVKSGRLIVGIVCERTEKFSSSNKKFENTLFDFNQLLEEKRNYTPSEYSYDFSLMIPVNVSQGLEGISNNLIKVVKDLIGQNSFTKWFLYAKLQCKGVNLSKRVQINIV